CRENRAPQTGRPIGGHLEAIAPGAGVGKVTAEAKPSLGLEIIGRGQHDELLRPSEALERNIALLAHHAAAAVGADQVAAAVCLVPVGGAYIDRYRAIGLSDVDDLVPEQHLDVW